MNHLVRRVVKCKSRAQHRLREMGLCSMGDVLSPAGHFLPWTDVYAGGGDRMGEKAYNSLISNLVAAPIIEANPGPHHIFFLESNPLRCSHVWQFDVSPQDVAADWHQIVGTYTPSKTFRVLEGVLRSDKMVLPAINSRAHKVLLRLPTGRDCQNSLFGPWNSDSMCMEQYLWPDDRTLPQKSTAQLRMVQAAHRCSTHSAITKWELQLNCSIPADIWTSTWLLYRSAIENAFLWQLIYRVIATQRWRFPSRPTTDETTWCTRCSGGHHENVLHRLWDCEISLQMNAGVGANLCWDWLPPTFTLVFC